jgi:hypothetical protein
MDLVSLGNRDDKNRDHVCLNRSRVCIDMLRKSMLGFLGV